MELQQPLPKVEMALAMARAQQNPGLEEQAEQQASVLTSMEEMAAKAALPQLIPIVIPAVVEQVLEAQAAEAQPLLLATLDTVLNQE